MSHLGVCSDNGSEFKGAVLKVRSWLRFRLHHMLRAGIEASRCRSASWRTLHSALARAGASGRPAPCVACSVYSFLYCVQVERFNQTMKGLTARYMSLPAFAAHWVAALERATYYYNFFKVVRFLPILLLLLLLLCTLRHSAQDHQADPCCDVLRASRPHARAGRRRHTSTASAGVACCCRRRRAILGRGDAGRRRAQAARRR